jgi:hypothetical protein
MATELIQNIWSRYGFQGNPFDTAALSASAGALLPVSKAIVGSDQLDSALSQTLDELSPIILDPFYSSASEQEKIILQAVSVSFKTYAFDEILQTLKSAKLQITKGPLSTMLSRLTEKGILVKTERGKYRVVNRLFNEFIARK